MSNHGAARCCVAACLGWRSCDLAPMRAMRIATERLASPATVDVFAIVPLHRLPPPSVGDRPDITSLAAQHPPRSPRAVSHPPFPLGRSESNSSCWLPLSRNASCLVTEASSSSHGNRLATKAKSGRAKITSSILFPGATESGFEGNRRPFKYRPPVRPSWPARCRVPGFASLGSFRPLVSFSPRSPSSILPPPLFSPGFLLQRVSSSLDFRFRGLRLLSTGRETSIAAPVACFRGSHGFDIIAPSGTFVGLISASTNYPPNLWVSLSFARFSSVSHLRPAPLCFLACILLSPPLPPSSHVSMSLPPVTSLCCVSPNGPNRRHSISGSLGVRLDFNTPASSGPRRLSAYPPCVHATSGRPAQLSTRWMTG